VRGTVLSASSLPVDVMLGHTIFPLLFLQVPAPMSAPQPAQ
jgi:hypothetical protein